MTKKSDSRLKRDALAKQAAAEGVDETWEKLEEVYQSHMNLFVEYGKMAALITNDGVRPYLEDESATANLMKGLASDSASMQTRTQELHAKHAGRTGTADDEESWFAVTMLHQDYIMLMAQHQQTCLPIMLELDEHLQKALKRRAEAEEAALVKAAEMVANGTVPADFAPATNTTH